MNLAYMEVDRRQIAYNSLPESTRQAFLQRLMVSWVYHDHALEGVVLTFQDIQRALQGSPAHNHCEGRKQASIRNMMACIQFVMDADMHRDPVSLPWIKELHERLCHGVSARAGVYRKRNNASGVYNLDVAPASSISYHMRKVLDALENEYRSYHPVQAAAYFHWDLMQVFPFEEQNGLLARLVMNAILMNANYSPALIHAIERPQYYAALRGSRQEMVTVVVDALGNTVHAAGEFARQHISEEVAPLPMCG